VLYAQGIKFDWSAISILEQRRDSPDRSDTRTHSHAFATTECTWTSEKSRPDTFLLKLRRSASGSIRFASSVEAQYPVSSYCCQPWSSLLAVCRRSPRLYSFVNCVRHRTFLVIYICTSHAKFMYLLCTGATRKKQKCYSIQKRYSIILELMD